MLPVTNTVSTTPTPPPLVNTTTPGTNETHAPPTIVAPSFTTAQVDNNARGNPNFARPNNTAPSQAPAENTSSASVGVPPSASDKFTLGAQTNFLAQLIGQDITPSVQGVLAQYEKLVNISNVKYAPSNAFKPQEQPASLFSQFLEAEQPQPQTRITATELTKAQSFTATVIAAAASDGAPETVANTRPINELQNTKISRANTPSFSEEIDNEDADVATQAPRNTNKPPPAISAYLNTASRVKSQGVQDQSDEDTISQVA